MEQKSINVAVPMVGEEEAEAVRKVLLSGKYVSGSRVEEFEREFAGYIGTKYAVAVNSGTAALHIALEAMGVKRGDEVIVPPLTFFATVSSVLYLGAVPVFADIDLDDLCLSAESVEQKITPRTKAAIPVHLFGAPAKMDKFMALSKTRKVPLLEDCAQAHGTEYKQKKVGGFGTAGAFSFFATKHMTTGEGGLITTNESRIAEASRIIRNHGMKGRDYHVKLGFNHRMTEMEAAMGLVQIKKLDQNNAARIKNSEYLLDRVKELSWAVVPLPAQKNIRHTYFWCPVMVDPSSGKDVEQLKEHLQKNKIGFRHRYKEPLYRQPVLKDMGLDYSEVFLPNAENAAGKVIGLPNHPGLTRDDLERITDVLREF